MPLNKRYIFIVWLFTTQIVSSQIIFSSQEDVDNYPSICTSCEVINNSIIINGKIANFDSLSIVRKIEGTIQVLQIDSLVDWTGFNNVDTITGAFGGSLIFVPFTLNGFENLKSINGIQISQMPNLQAITAFKNLEEIKGSLRISNCESLKQISDFNSLQTANMINIGANDNLEDLKGFNSLKSMQSLSVIGNEKLKTINIGDKLDSIYNSLQISINSSLESIDGFTDIQYIGEDLFLVSNHSLKTLSGFENLVECTNLNFATNGNLQEMPAFENLKKVNENFTLSGLKSIENIEGFNSLEYVTGVLRLSHFDSIVNISGFNSYTGGKEINLINLSLNKIEGFNNISSISEVVYVFGTRLTDLSFLSPISSIDGDFIISTNLFINDLANLQHLDLSQINFLSITDNSNLSICHQKWVCDYIRAGVGAVDVKENMVGCNTVDEVLQGCIVNIDEELLSEFKVIPNPTSNYINIATEHHITKVRVFDALGRTVLTTKPDNNKIDVQALQNGTYFIHIDIQNGNRTVVNKFIKI